MRETEPQQQRDQDAEYTLEPTHEFAAGTVSQLRQDVSIYALQRLGFDSFKPPTPEQVYNIVSGRRADGERTGRQIMPVRQYENKVSRPKDFMDVTISPDISWGLALANAETHAGRALILSTVHAAADDTMRKFAEHVGVTRRGADFRIEQGELAWIRFTHHTARPAQDGFVSPSLHMHHVIPNAVLTPSGHVGAIHMKQMIRFTGEINLTFYRSLAQHAASAGIATRPHSKTQAPIVDAVSDDLRMSFAKRSADIRSEMQKYPNTPTAAVRRIIELRMQGVRQDGMADRNRWRDKMASHGWLPQDVAKPGQAVSSPKSEQPLTLVQRAQRLKQAMVQTLQVARHQIEQAQIHKRLGPSVARTAQLVRALVPELTRRARDLAHRIRQDYSPKQARLAGQHMQRMAGVHTLAKEFSMSDYNEVPKTERMLRVYARKVHEGEVSMSHAATRFALAEERRDRIGVNPVHQTEIYKEGGATPSNRTQREEKWADRIGDKVEALRNGQSIWPEQAKQVQQPEHRQQMRMTR